MTVQFIGWALVHSLWQGALITIVTTIALTLARRSPSRRRYGILLTALLLTAVAPPMTSAFLRGPGLRGSSGQITVLSGTNARSAVDTVALPADASSVAVQSDRPSAAPTATLSGSDASSASSAAVELAGAAREWLDRLMPWLVGLWLAGVALLSVRLVGGIRYTRRLLDDAVGSVDARLDAAVRRLAASVGVRRTVRVLQTARGHVPLVMGWLRPVLVVPASMLLGLSPTQLELILVHELAHIRRYDFLVNVVQAVIETLLFYHPAVWWLSSRIREEREHCCDDIALETLGADGMTYARALLTIGGRTGHGRWPRRGGHCRFTAPADPATRGG